MNKFFNLNEYFTTMDIHSEEVKQSLINNIPYLGTYPEREDLNRFIAQVSSFFNVSSDNVFIFPGSKEAIKTIIGLMNKLVYLPISYQGFMKSAISQNHETIKVNSHEQAIDFLIENDNSVYFIDSPNYFTGKVINYEEVVSLSKNLNNNSFLFVDCSGSLIFHNNNVFDAIDNVAFIGSFSKSFMLPGIRLGYVICGKKVANIFNNVDITKEIPLYSIKVADTLIKNVNYYRDLRSKNKNIRMLNLLYLKDFLKDDYDICLNADTHSKLALMINSNQRNKIERKLWSINYDINQITYWDDIELNGDKLITIRPFSSRNSINPEETSYEKSSVN